MTGGPHGTHRGRDADPHGGVHWWRGHGPTGGGTHAVGGPRRRRAVLALVVLAVVAVLAAGVALLVAGRDGGSADAASTGGPASAPLPASDPADGAHGDGAALQAQLDAVLGSAPMRFGPGAAEPLNTSGLAPLAAALRAAPGVPVTVEGHNASVGTDGTRSQELSEQRATGVARSLAALGVDPARMRTVGLGDTRPRATLEASRRVELRAG